MVSFAPPSSRFEYLKRKQFEWGVWVHKLPRPTVTAQITPSNPDNDDKNNHFIYVCIKGKKNEQDQAEVEQQQ